MDFLLGIIYFAVSGAVIYSMTVLLLQGEKSFSNKMYMVCHLCVAVWCSSQIFIMLSESTAELALTYLYGNVGICFAGAFWILFSLSYGKKDSFRLRPLYLLPLGLSLVHYGLIITNGFHHKYYYSFEKGNITRGLFFYTNVVETYLFIIIGAVILFKNVRLSRKKNPVVKGTIRGSILIVFTVLTPLIFSIIYLAGIVKTEFDITPLGFAVSVMLVRTATTRYQFFDMKRELSITNEKLILEKERNRIAQQVHDTTGHTLTMLQSYMKLTEVSVRENKQDEALGYISEARQLTGHGIKELRESINQLKQEEESQLVTQAVMQLAHQVKEIPCEVDIQGEDSEMYSSLTSMVYSTVRESITNTLKYANASRIDIVIRFRQNVLELIIADDGNGAEEINDNNGLRGIRERIEKQGGNVKFITSKGEGFMTRVSLPL